MSSTHDNSPSSTVADQVDETSEVQGMELSTKGTISRANRVNIIQHLLEIIENRFSDVTQSVLCATKITNLKKWPAPDEKTEYTVFEMLKLR